MFEAMIALTEPVLRKPERWFFRAAGAASTAVTLWAESDVAYAALTSSTLHVTAGLFIGAQLVFRIELLGYVIALLRR